MNDSKFKKLLKSLYSYLLFFILVSFIITCNMMLFLTILLNSPYQNIEIAAKLTLGNVVFLSLLLTVVNGIIKRYTVHKPARRIIDAAEKMMDGDFSVRIKTNRFISRHEEFKEIANCFNKMAAELEGVETLRTDFISNVSHEIKTPLAVIRNYTVLLQDKDLSPEKKNDYIRHIDEASCRLSSLITNILKLNKLENQQIKPAFERFNLSENLCENIIPFESIWDDKAIEIETDIDDEVYIVSDKEMLGLVWSNLLSNAFKFTEKGGTVSVSVKKDNEYAVVSISDTGCGISEDVGKRMFDKFYQGDTSHATQGNGLGLALVKRVIDITGGSISVKSKLNEGTTFTVRLRSE